MPAYGNFVLDKGYDAAAQITKFRGVKLTANAEEVAQVAASTDIMHGVAQFDVLTADLTRGKGASVRVAGISEMEIGAAVTRGAEVMCDTSGRAIPATGAGNRVIGRALEGASVSGNRVPVLIYQSSRVL